MGRLRIEVPSDSIDITLHVKDQLVYQPVSEFNTGIRQGNASNDDRNLASFFAFEDARAGIGTAIGDVRETIDQLADTDGLVARQFNELIRPPKLTLDLGGTASDAYVVKPFESDYVASGPWMLYTIGPALQYQPTDGSGSPSPLGGLTNTIRDARVYTSPVDGDQFLIVGNEVDNAEYNKGGAQASISAAKILQSFQEFDGKLFAAGLGELWWTIDPESGWNELAGNWPREWQFIGVFPFGDTYMMYALTNPYERSSHSEIVVVDVDSNTVYPLRLGIGSINAAVGIRSEIGIIAEAGREVFLYEPRNRNIRDLDWRATERNGFDITNRDALARDLIEHRRGVVVVGEVQTAVKQTQLFIHTGTGWHPYGATMYKSLPSNHFTPMANGSTYSTSSQVFWVNASSDHANTWFMGVLPWFDEPYTPGVDQSVGMDITTQYAVTPWYNMGFSDLPGVALTLKSAGWWDATHKIGIEYQTDFDTTAWTSLGYYPNTGLPASPEITNRVSPVEAEDTLVFGTSETLHGVAFNWIRFRIEFLATSATSKSPNAFPLVFRFIKRPQLRDSIRFEIDWAETRGANPDISTIKDLVNVLRNIYNATTIPKVTINEEVTYAMVTSYPRVPVLGPSIHPVASDVDYEDATLVLTMAEAL